MDNESRKFVRVDLKRAREAREEISGTPKNILEAILACQNESQSPQSPQARA